MLPPRLHMKQTSVWQIEISRCLNYSPLLLMYAMCLDVPTTVADRKKIREINPDEEKLSKSAGEEGGGGKDRGGADGGSGGGGGGGRENPDMIPISNSTSSSNMALISNGLAAYNYISGKVACNLNLTLNAQM